MSRQEQLRILAGYYDRANVLRQEAEKIQCEVHEGLEKYLKEHYGFGVGTRAKLTYRKIECEVVRITRIRIVDGKIDGMNLDYRPVKKDNTLHSKTFDCWVNMYDIIPQEATA